MPIRFPRRFLIRQDGPPDNSFMLAVDGKCHCNQFGQGARANQALHQRVVPKVEREEFVNVGVIVSCPARGFLEARIELDQQRLMALDSTLDVESIRVHLATIPTICTGGGQAGPIGQLSQRERFHWLVAPRSTIIQTSPVHTGRCKNPTAVLEHLLDTMVRPSREESPAAETGLVGTSEDGE